MFPLQIPYLVLEPVLCPDCSSADGVKHGCSAIDKKCYECRNRNAILPLNFLTEFHHQFCICACGDRYTLAEFKAAV